MIVFVKHIYDTEYKIIHHVDYIELIYDKLIEEIIFPHNINSAEHIKRTIANHGFYMNTLNNDFIFNTNYKYSYSTLIEPYLNVKKIIANTLIQYNRSLQTTKILK